MALDFTQPLPPAKNGMPSQFLYRAPEQAPFSNVLIHEPLGNFNSVDDDGNSADPDRGFDLVGAPGRESIAT